MAYSPAMAARNSSVVEVSISVCTPCRRTQPQHHFGQGLWTAHVSRKNDIPQARIACLWPKLPHRDPGQDLTEHQGALDPKALRGNITRRDTALGQQIAWPRGEGPDDCDKAGRYPLANSQGAGCISASNEGTTGKQDHVGIAPQRLFDRLCHMRHFSIVLRLSQQG